MSIPTLLTAASYATEKPSPLVMLMIIPFGLYSLVLGLRTWRGEEAPFVVEHQRRHGPMTTPISYLGARRHYQTVLGVGHVGIPFGIGATAIATSELLRQLLGQPPGWWFFYVVGYPAFFLLTVGGFYSLAYFWTGVPDWARPPSQRGWKLTNDGFELVRPEAFPPSERARSGIDDRSWPAQGPKR